MATVTWRGLSGSWSNPLSWQSFQVPGSLDTALFTGGSGSLATIDGTQSVGSAQLAAGSDVTLAVQGTLLLGTALTVSGGTLDLAAGGTIIGGTVDLAGGSLDAGGGTADGVTWLGAFGNGLAITAATAAATQSALGSLEIVGALTLDAGTYDGFAFVASTFASAAAQLEAAAGGTVTLGPATTLYATADDPLHEAQVPPGLAGLTLGGPGTFVNAGLVTSDLAAVDAPLTINSAGFANSGTIALNTTMVPDEQQRFTIYQGRLPQTVTLTFNASFAPGLLEAAASFTNTGAIIGQGASMEVTGAAFANAGTVALGTAAAETPIVTSTQAYVGTITLASTLDFSAGVTTFSNTGTLAASLIEFDNSFSLSQLGTVQGDVLFRGTLDLAGGTLDVGKLDPTGSFTFAGTVKNGTLIRDGGTLVTTGATLSGVTVLDQAPGVILDATSGSVTLDAATTELAYTTAATIDQLGVVAGAVGTTDAIGARAPGTLSFGAATLITDTVAGSTLEIGGAGTFSDAGQITLDGSTLGIATLDGTGTISLADGAALQIGALAPSSDITVSFGAGSNLLSLPAGASGMNGLGLILAGLRPGDVIDFAGLSSNPPPGLFGNPGAGVQNDTLFVQSASGAQASIALADSGTGLGFAVTSDAAGGTLVTVTCFLHGTRIATPTGEVPVERLRIGDLVLTGSGAARPIRWLGRRAYGRRMVAAQPQLRPVRLRRGSLGGGLPHRDLYVSPLHALLLAAPDGRDVLVPAGALVNGDTITRGPIAAVAYVHIELETPDTVLAEGARAETFVDCGSRWLFENAAEFATLYPGAADHSWQFCAPRIEEGWVLQSIRAALAGQSRPAPGGSRLAWHIDRQDDGCIEGWAFDHDSPDTAVEIELTTPREPLGRIVANRYRIDLDHAGLGHGGCGFSVDLPELDAAALASVRLRALASGVVLTP